jgi:hypothetical protein
MAGPVPTYLSTQTAAQTAFNVPFGLLALVNSAIATATADGKFNTTVDCSLFMAEDIANLAIYLRSLGYTGEFAKNSSERALLITWDDPLDIDGNSSQSVTQGTTPWIVEESPSTDANVTTVVVTTSSTQLLGPNPNRKGIIIQSKDSPLRRPVYSRISLTYGLVWHRQLQ